MKLGRGYKVNGNSKRSYEKAIWQEETKSTRIEDREQHVIRSQKYPFESTRKDMDLLGFQRTLVKECFSWNFQKDG